MDYICDDEVAGEEQGVVRGANREPQVAGDDSPLQVDELEVALLQKRSRGVHPARAGTRGGTKGVLEHACTLRS